MVVPSYCLAIAPTSRSGSRSRSRSPTQELEVGPRSPPQELVVGPRSELYLLVAIHLGPKSLQLGILIFFLFIDFVAQA